MNILIRFIQNIAQLAQDLNFPIYGGASDLPS